MLLTAAGVFARRSTCSRGQTGAVFALRGRVLSSGYNGAPSGMPHCDHSCDCDVATRKYAGPPRRPTDVPSSGHSPYCRSTQSCTTAVHAEANAVAFAARHGVALDDSTLYTTMTPCVPCAQLIINVGVVWVVALRWYRERGGWELLDRRGIQLEIAELAEHHASGYPGNDPYPCPCGAMT